MEWEYKEDDTLMVELRENIIMSVSKKTNIKFSDCKIILEKSLITGEIISEEDIDRWLTERFLPNLVFIEPLDYAQMCFNSLKIIKTTASTDYGSSRQRDFGQMWTDLTRGYLGEIAFAKFAKKNYNTTINLDHDKGSLKDYLPSDISSITADSIKRKANLNVSIKTTKFNGIWLDIPGDQFSHSDIYILVKIAIDRDHLFSFFKKISVFKDKVLKYGLDMGILTETETEEIYNEIPTFSNIPAYITGYLKAADYLEQNPIYKGRTGRKHYSVDSWAEKISDEKFQSILNSHNLSGTLKFNGIGKFSHSNGYVFSPDHFAYSAEDWKKFFDSL